MIRFIAALAALLPCLAFGQVDLSVVHSTYDGPLSDFGAQIRAGQSVYLWGSYEQPELKLVGQSIGSVETWGVGIGFRKTWDRLDLFGEFGYFMPGEANTPDNIRDEAVWTALINDHGRDGKAGNWKPEFTSYALDDGYGGRVGAAYEITNHLTVSAAYRFLTLEEEMQACQGTEPCRYPETMDAGLNHWESKKGFNLNAFEVGIGVRF